MQLQLQGKSVLVTGSSRGIGRAIAEAFLAEGAEVAFNGRNAEDLERIVASQAGTNAIYVTGDVCKPDQARKVFEQVIKSFGKLDVLVCNVGSGRSVPPGSESYDEWIRVFDLNFLSTTNMVELSKEALVDSQGSIVCISSICGLEVVPGAPLTYSAAKAALNAYVRGVARPLGKSGVRINAIAPGNINFNGSVWQKKIIEDSLAVELMLEKDVALSKLGSLLEISNLVLCLASPITSFCTGSIFVADGGQVHS